MSLPLLVHSKLFWYNNGKLDACWGLGMKDGTSVKQQDDYIRDMDRFGIDTITLNICNEELSSPFSGEFMNSSWHEAKINMWFNYARRLKNAGKNVIVVYFDFPGSLTGDVKYPFWKYRNRIPEFLKIGTMALAPIADGFIFGIESNRKPGPTLEELDYCVKIMQTYAVRHIGNNQWVDLPVGTHEQSYRIAPSADFIGYETRNHPLNGDSVSVKDMTDDVKGLVSRAKGKYTWVIESNSSDGAHARAQNNAMAAIPGVHGVGGPL